MEVSTHACHDGAGGSDTTMEMNPATESISQSTWITRDRDIDSLDPARGILVGCLIGIDVWLILADLIMIF